MTDDTPWLHIRMQSCYHGEAEIRGTRHGLQVLSDTVAAALAEGSAEGSVFASDGEGYCLSISRHRTVSSLAEPEYLDEIAFKLAAYHRDTFIKHDKIMRKQNREALEALKWCRANGNPHVAESAAHE